MKYLVTGTAGFIGHYVALELARAGHSVVGIDNLNEYYDQSLKFARLSNAGFKVDVLKQSLDPIFSDDFPSLSFIKMDLSEKQKLFELFESNKFDRVVHLAAQAGVRYSIENPNIYIESNITGTLNILEACKAFGCSHLVFASSSSVYGLNDKVPFKVSDAVDHPVSLYASTKRSNELMAHNYSHLFSIPITCLRFFTVYGPWGRPDMALFKFTKAILEGREIEVYNNGNLSRDFTYVEDIAEGVIRVCDHIPVGSSNASPNLSTAPFRIFNIGRGQPVALLGFIHSLESALGVKAIKKMSPMQPGDVEKTWADVEDLNLAIDFKPKTDLDAGVKKFVEWYREFYHGSL